MKNFTIISTILLLLTNTDYTFSQTKNDTVKNPIEYINHRHKAISLVKNEKWQEAIPVLKNLTEQNQTDADLFYLLGLCYIQVDQYQNATTSLKQTLDLGGTILTDIPKGSAPSNDIMIKIAKAYAKNGDKNNAISWLKKGFTFRYDEKPFLQSNPDFESLNNDIEFKKLFGYAPQENITREEAWVLDINYLEKRINELHYSPNHVLSETDLSNAFLDIIENVAGLSDEEIIVKLMKVVGSLGNGHNLIIPTSPNIGALKSLPIQFYQFDDGLYIVNTAKGFEQWIGYKVESFDNTPTEEALHKTNVVNARDNNMQTLWLGPYYLGLPDVLKEIGIIQNSNQITLTLSDKKGGNQKVTFVPISWNFTGFPKLPMLKEVQQPLFLSKIDDPYWYKLLQENKTIYVQFNAVTDKETQSLKDFNIELRNQIVRYDIDNLILDLRHNHGGNGSILPPMLKTIISFEVMKPDAKIFVLMGRETFSAGQNLLTDITKYTNAILVGEPSGSKPNHIGEAGWFKLPYSGLMGLISTQFHQTSIAEDHRNWIAPHIPISPLSTDYFNGNDKALNIIMDIIKSDKD